MDETRGQDALEHGVGSDTAAPGDDRVTAAMRILLDEHPTRPGIDRTPATDGWTAVDSTADGRGPAATEDEPSEHMVRIPASLLARVIATITEVRAEVAALRAQAVAAEHAGEDAPTNGQHQEACMVVLNMALNGAPQSEAEQYLARHFPHEDSAAVATEIYHLMAGMLTS
jgi:hypothetical protein